MLCRVGITSVEVSVVREAKDESVGAFARLLPQLSSTAGPLGHEAVGRLLTLLAEAAGARTVDLTSRPSREAANRLYERLGFEARDSTVYRFVLKR
ncbi:hypothetical protein [Streptomyces sp. NPDC007883]|uniref:hypothetical protein n=1 Tax=Streptomyces sp. NPDC007883 TaxID=3155116 RepID=UPI0033D2D327